MNKILVLNGSPHEFGCTYTVNDLLSCPQTALAFWQASA